MTTADTDWKPLARAMVDQLRDGGHLSHPGWRAAFRDVPRHLFAPEVIELGDAGYRTLTAADGAAWLARVYSDVSLVTQHRPHHAGYTLPDGSPVQVPTSSSTMPSLMASMIEALDIRPGHRVLEIGTGTGYNAAILAHQLGADHVVTIDIDPDLTAAAAARLDQLGHRGITVVTGDGTAGAPEHGPYDRIIATAAVPEIPLAWVEQLAVGGSILANLRGDITGEMCLLDRHGTAPEVVGSFLHIGGNFMWVRPEVDDPHRPHEIPHRTPPTASRIVTAEEGLGALVDHRGYRFMLQLQCPGLRLAACDSTTGVVTLAASDGSRAEATPDPDDPELLHVEQHGPRRLWDTAAVTYDLWYFLQQPDPDAFDIVVNRTTQIVTFDHEHTGCQWPLPLV